MKKLIVVGIAALSLTLTACGNQSFNSSDRQTPDKPQYSASEMDPNNRSVYNNNKYCNGHTYVPLANDEYQCEDMDHSGVIILPHHSRSKYTTAPKLTTPSKAPVVVPKAPTQAPKPAAPAPKPAAPKPAAPAPKAPAPAPYKAPAKTGK